MVKTISAQHLPREALDDLWNGLTRYEAWLLLAVHELRQRFRRSLLGPLWLTVSMGVLVATLSLISSTLFGRDLTEQLPYIAAGIIMWGLLTNCITDGSTVFISNENHIRNIPMPISVHLYQTLAHNLMIWGFNMLIYVGVFLVVRPPLTGHSALIVFGLPLFFVNAAWMALMAGILSTRYRDVPQVIISFIQVVFFLTPVFWSAADLPQRPVFVVLNPLYHLIEIVRQPLLGAAASKLSWAACLAMAVVGWGLTLYLYRRAYARIAYWV